MIATPSSGVKQPPQPVIQNTPINATNISVTINNYGLHLLHA